MEAAMESTFSRLYDQIDAAEQKVDYGYGNAKPGADERPILTRKPSIQRPASHDSENLSGDETEKCKAREGRSARRTSLSGDSVGDDVVGRARSKSRTRSTARSKSRAREAKGERPRNRGSRGLSDAAQETLGLSSGIHSGDVPDTTSQKSRNSRTSLTEESLKSNSSKENDKPARPRMAKTSSCRELQSNSSLGLKPSHLTTGKGSVASKDDYESLEVKTQLYKEEFQRAQKEKLKMKKQKDAEIERLTQEIAQLRQEIHASDKENRLLKESLQSGAGCSYRLTVLQDENARLQAELKQTVERASTMMKEREKAIDDLMQELENIRNESIQQRTMFDATLYKNKTKLERIDQEKDQYAQRVLELERLIAEYEARLKIKK